MAGCGDGARWILQVAVLGLAVLAGCSEGEATGDGAPADAKVTSDAVAEAGGCTAAACDDGLDCTTDTCTGTGCSHVPKADSCVIAGACVVPGTVKADAPCLACDPAADVTAWSAKAGPCDDGNACTQGDTCQAGVCSGKPTCNDANPCTADACAAIDGACSHTPTDGPCDDGLPCTAGDTCMGGGCAKGKAKTVCDDGNPCTKDACSPDKGGCHGDLDPLACDDGKACTADTCDPKKGCSHTDSKPTAPCFGGDACVTGETCDAALQCQGGKAKVCNDGNVCTTDSCKPSKGCVHTINKLGCDDGLPCTSPDLCTGGACAGVKTGSCPVCEKFFSPIAGKLTVFQIGKSGHPGEGIDVDGKPETCAPSTGCSAGVDNAASALAFFINKPLIDAVAEGTFSFVAELEGYQGEDKEFTLNLYQANLAPASTGCKPQSEVCTWLVNQAAMAGDCKPKFSFKKAKVSKGKLVAGGADTLFAMDADLLGAKNATLYVKGARIEATVAFTADGGLQAMQGVLGGAVPQQAVLDIIGALDPALFASVGLSKQQVIDLVKQILELDIDSDGDGEGDAASIGLRFSGIGAKIAGFDD